MCSKEFIVTTGMSILLSNAKFIIINLGREFSLTAEALLLIGTERVPNIRVR